MLRAKKDQRLYFSFISGTKLDGRIDLGKLKTELIRLGYIEHIEGDRYKLIKKMNREQVINEVFDRLDPIMKL